jgi:hypothetical protein
LGGDVMFDEIYTPEQAKAFSDYIKATIEFYRKVTPKFVRINESYFNKMLNDGVIEKMTIDSDSRITIGVKNVIPLHAIPVVIDNSIETYSFEY